LIVDHSSSITDSSSIINYRSVRSRGRATVPGFLFLESQSARENINRGDTDFSISIDDKLIEEARCIGKHNPKKEAVTAALEAYIQHRKQLRILEAFGTVDFDPEYDYKAARRRKRME
jgi:ATP-dependent helicase YprA (DUF1998 family)